VALQKAGRVPRPVTGDALRVMSDEKINHRRIDIYCVAALLSDAIPVKFQFVRRNPATAGRSGLSNSK
jgi:hypothetical protein